MQARERLALADVVLNRVALDAAQGGLDLERVLAQVGALGERLLHRCVRAELVNVELVFEVLRVEIFLCRARHAYRLQCGTFTFTVRFFASCTNKAD